MKRTLTCIICPRGCTVTVESDGNNTLVSGNSCKKGEQYAISECFHPVRTVTATVRVSNRYNTMVSVKTKKPVGKENMHDVMAILRQMAVEAPLNIGDVILQDAWGSEVVVTKSVK